MSLTTESYVKKVISGAIATVEFYTPQHNSLPGFILDKLSQIIDSLSADEKIKVVILKSGGERTFCAGANFEEMLAIEDAASGKKFFMGFAKVILSLRNCSKPVLGRVQGKAVGGGVGLIAATDYCMATKYAAIRLSELSIGIGPFVIEPAIVRKAGITAMTQLSLRPDKFYPPEWAREHQLYNKVFQSTEEMDEEVNQLATQIAGYNPDALKAMKKVLWRNTEDWENLLEERAEISGALVLSSATKEHLRKFK